MIHVLYIPETKACRLAENGGGYSRQYLGIRLYTLLEVHAAKNHHMDICQAVPRQPILVYLSLLDIVRFAGTMIAITAIFMTLLLLSANSSITMIDYNNT